MAGPPPGRNVAVCFPFILPLSEKPKGHLSDSAVVDGTRSSHGTETSPVRVQKLWLVVMEKLLPWGGKRGQVCSFDDEEGDQQTCWSWICFWSCHVLEDERLKCSSSQSIALCLLLLHFEENWKMKFKKFITIMQAAMGIVPLNKRELLPPGRKLWRPPGWVRSLHVSGMLPPHRENDSSSELHVAKLLQQFIFNRFDPQCF